MNKQVGGGVHQPYRFFHPNAQPFKPCKGCGSMIPVAKPSKQEGGGVSMPYRWFKPNAIPFKPCSNCDFGNVCGGRRQTGGFPTGAPMGVFSQGEQQLKYNFNLEENFSGLPVFDNVGRNNFF